ncbi:MAG: tetratricopeptide repeat protein [Reichenbachiella sp.]
MRKIKLSMMRVVFFVFIATLLITSCGGEEGSLGDKLYESKDYKKAISAYDEYLKLHPENIKSLYNRGRCFEELKNYNQAVKDFLMVLDIDGNNTAALLSMSKHQYRSGNYEKAIGYAEHAVKLKDDLAEGHFWLGRAHHHLGDFPAAILAYNNAINLDKEYGEAYLYRGAVKVAENKKTAGCKDFQKAKELKVPQAESAIKNACK